MTLHSVLLLVAMTLIGGQAVDASQNDTRASRHCFDCEHSVSSGSWAPCLAPVARSSTHRPADHRVVEAPLCTSNCFTRIQPNGDMRRGCFDQRLGVNASLLGCHVQGPRGSLYCFCQHEFCNDLSSPHVAPYTVEASVEGEQIVIEPERPALKQQELHIDNEEDTEVEIELSTYQPPSLVLGGEPLLHPRISQSTDNLEHMEPRVALPKPQLRDTVYGLQALSEIFPNSDISQNRRDYEFSEINDKRHSIHVSIVNEKKESENESTAKKSAEHGVDIKQKGKDDFHREYVEHIQKQRQADGKYEVRSDVNTSVVSLAASPEVEHTRTEHFHKYHVGERTIEHHIVEHYVLHHRIKELLRREDGIDVHNLDPRKVSLIYKLLHPRARLHEGEVAEQ